MGQIVRCYGWGLGEEMRKCRRWIVTSTSHRKRCDKCIVKHREWYGRFKQGRKPNEIESAFLDQMANEPHELALRMLVGGPMGEGNKVEGPAGFSRRSMSYKTERA